uniref:RNA helicase n=1 Tax=Parhyale hawaiensis TaxID=317513 RepID=B7SFY1_9CRUS|nr:Vasa [Parhyale hawaiensis]
MSDWEEEKAAAGGCEVAEWNGGAETNGYGSGSRGRGGFGRGGRGRGGGGGRGGSTGCRKCGEEGHRAFECTSGGGGGNRACFKCGKEGHMSRECPQGGGQSFGGGGGNRGCFKCGEEGHTSRGCPNSGGGGKGCFKCGEDGHMARDCPQGGDGGGGGGGNRGCFNCGEQGHNKADCPNPPKDNTGELGPDGKPRPPLYVPEHIADEQLFSEGVNPGINSDAYHNIPVSVSGEGEIPDPIDTFGASGLRDLLISNIERAGYKTPTPIQRVCIPTIMAGRDIMGCAQTGSGKTAAFLLPILHGILASGGGNSGSMSSTAEPSAVVVAPTRELAIQIHNEARKFALDSIVRTVVCYGGASMNSQYRQLQNGCAVLVATPGRLNDFVTRGRVSFSSVKYLVLDEADRMLDMGFIGDIEKIVNHQTMPAVGQRQTLLFSATFPEEIQTLACNHLQNYVFYAVGTVGAANTDVCQEVLNVPRQQKREVLMSKIEEFMANGDNKVLIFVETKRTADFLATLLSSQQLNSTSIHGDRFQSQREEALAQFKAGIRSILVATAVAARGLDIRGVSHVINYDLPKEVDEYVHRIGRTGRVGNKGHAVSFYDEEQDGALAKNLVKILTDASQEVPEWLKNAAAHSGHSQTYHGVGDFASHDIRGEGLQREGSSQAFGGPAPVDEEEEW